MNLIKNKNLYIFFNVALILGLFLCQTVYGGALSSSVPIEGLKNLLADLFENLLWFVVVVGIIAFVVCIIGSISAGEDEHLHKKRLKRAWISLGLTIIALLGVGIFNTIGSYFGVSANI